MLFLQTLSLVFLSSTVYNAHAYIPQQSIDTALEMKCKLLNMQTNTLFMDSSCFIATKGLYVPSYEAHLAVGQLNCDEIHGYRNTLAIVRTREQINALLHAGVVQPRGRYYIGALQSPKSNCGDRLCTYADPQHHKDWYFFDAEGNKVEELNKDLWLSLEPDNEGPHPPEHVVTLEHLGDTRLGFNDVTGVEMMPFLCQYQDVMVCPESFTLIRDTCYKAVNLNRPIDASDAQEYCESNFEGTLASIHNEKQNTYLASLARESANYTYNQQADEIEQWGPFLIGLQFIDSQWQWTDGSEVDYFRWFAEKGGSANMLYSPKQNGFAYLQTTTNANRGQAGFGYWSNNFKDNSHSVPVRRIICQVKPKIVLPTVIPEPDNKE